MEGHCSTGQSPQWAVVPMEEEEEEILCICYSIYTIYKWAARRIIQPGGPRVGDPWSKGNV